MKKTLSLMLVLLMVAMIAVPAVSAAPDGPTTLQYKTETFKRFRNSPTSTAANGYERLNYGVAVTPARFPLYGDSAVIGVHTNMGESYYLGEDYSRTDVNNGTMKIGVIGEDYAGGSVYTNRALKLKGDGATDITAVSFGFIPNDVLANSEAVYFKWQERAVSGTLGTDAKVMLQWVDATGLAITDGTVATINHSASVSTTEYTYTDVTFTATNESVSYNGGTPVEVPGFDLTTPPTGAVGLKLLLGFKGGERYYKSFEVGTSSYTAAAIEGDLMYFDDTATSVTVKFASPITEATKANVKLYNGVGEIVATTPTWASDSKSVTLALSAALGANGAYRVSTSKASTENGDIANDVRFTTRFLGTTATAAAISDASFYDLSGNKYAAITTITTSTADYNASTNPTGKSGTIEVKMYVPDGSDAPTAIVPVFKSGSDLAQIYYGTAISDFDSFNTDNRYILNLINGATAVPYKNFAVKVGSSTNLNNSYRYAVSFTTETLPANVIATVAPVMTGETIDNVGLLSPVKVSFDYPIDNTSCITIEENGSLYDASNYTLTWAADKKSVEIAPTVMWAQSGVYSIIVEENASIFGATSTIDTGAGLSFTVTSEVPVAATVESAVLSTSSMYSFDETNKTIVICHNTADTGASYTNVAVTVELSTVAAFVEANSTEYHPSFGDNEVSFNLDLSSAIGIENAVEFAVDNGFDEETVYKVYIEEFDPVSEEITVYGSGIETFESANVGDEWLNKSTSIIANAGYTGFNKEKELPNSNTEGQYAKVIDDEGNKVLHLYSDSNNSHAGFATPVIDAEYVSNSDKMVFAFDYFKPDDKVAANGRFWIFSDHGNIGSGNGVRDVLIWDYYSLFANDPAGGSNTLLTDSAWIQNYNKWMSMELIFERTPFPSGSGKEGSGTIVSLRVKEKGAAAWAETGSTIILDWDYTTSPAFQILWNRDNCEMYIDNVSLTKYYTDVKPEIELQKGDFIYADGHFDIKLKTPISLDNITDKIKLVDEEGTEVSYEYSLSADMLTLNIRPIAITGNKTYKINSTNLEDVFGNLISINFNVPVAPNGVEEYNTSTQYAVLSGDYAQTLDVYYTYDSVNKPEMSVTFGYGAGMNTSSAIYRLDRPQGSDAFAKVKVAIPADVITNAGGFTTINISSNIPIVVAGVNVVENFDLVALNAANTTTLADAQLAVLANLVNKAAILESLVDSVRDGLVADLIAKVGSVPFISKADAITWANTNFDAVAGANPNPDGPVPTPTPTPDGDDDIIFTGPVTPAPSGDNTASSDVNTDTKFPQFADLGEASWAKAAINALYMEGIIDGVSDTEFAPLQNVTREQFVKLVVVAFDLYDPFAASKFTDVEKGAWYESYVASATNAGIINGVNSAEFGVGQDLTREQMAAILKRAMDKAGIEINGYNTTRFSDASTISDYALGDVMALTKAGIINGIDGTFSPKLTANRAMAAQVIYLAYLLKK